jgi:hypothetical protein
MNKGVLSMLAYLSIFIGLFLIVLGLVAIYIGILTYVRLCSATGDLANDRHIVFMHGLAEADTPIYCPSRPLFTLACMFVVGLLPLSFGVLLCVRMVGIF